MFGLQINQTASVWNWFENIFPQSIYTLIVKVQRISYHRGDFPRYDVLLGPKDSVTQETLNAFTSELNERGCRARLHIPDRRLRPGARNRSTNDPNTPNNRINGVDASNRAASLMLVTLNVNSIKGKKAQVLHMMETIKADVLLLQETIRESSTLIWNLSFPGC